MAEAGLPQMTVNPSDWTGLLAPAGTPPVVVAKLNAAINEAVKSPEAQATLQARLATQEVRLWSSPPSYPPMRKWLPL